MNNCDYIHASTLETMMKYKIMQKNINVNKKITNTHKRTQAIHHKHQTHTKEPRLHRNKLYSVQY